MSEKDFYENLGQKVAKLTNMKTAFSGILKVSSTFTPEELAAHTANELESFMRGQLRDEVLTQEEAIQLFESQIDKDALSPEEQKRYAESQQEEEAVRVKKLISLYATQQAGQITQQVHAQLREKVAANDTFISLGDGRYTTKNVLAQENEILQSAAQMKANPGNPAAVHSAFLAAEENGHAAFFQFPSSNEDFEQAGVYTQTILSFSDLGILNGPPGTGKSTICQSVVFTMLQDETHTLLPEGAKIYATSSNPKAADALGEDLLNGVLVQDPPEAPKPLAENASDDERATYNLEYEEYAHTAARRSSAIYAIAKGLGKKYADMSDFNYTSANIESMLKELNSFMGNMTTDDARRRLTKRIEKLKAKYEKIKASKGKKNEKGELTVDDLPKDDQEFQEFKEDLYDAYIQGTYNAQTGTQKQDMIEQASFKDLIQSMNRGKVEKGSYIIVDEAGLMGREDMHALMKAASKAKVRLLLVGDNKQIPPQEAGHPFDLIVERVAENNGKEDETCSLTTKKILRQSSPSEKKAGIDIRNGVASKDPRRGIYVYETQTYKSGTEKAMSFTDSDEQATSALIQDYLTFVQANKWMDETQNPPKEELGHKKAVILTTTQEKADTLNASLREQMKQEGMLKAPFVHYGDLEMGTDDRIIFTQDETFIQNGRKVRINAGESAVCTTDAKNPNKVILKFSDKKSVTIDVTDKSNLAAFDSAHSSFALPLALAQGMSKDRAFLSLTEGDRLDGPNGLVAFTRHKKQMSAYISKKAYTDIDALAADIKKFPKGMNARDYVNANGEKAKPTSTRQMVEKLEKDKKRFKIQQNKFAYKQAAGKKKVKFLDRLKAKMQKTQ